MKQEITLNPSVAVVIVTWNNEKEITECLEPLIKLPENWQIWVSDNDSKDNTVKIVREKFSRVQVVENKANLGFAKGCNRAIEKTNADYVLLLNPDTVGKAGTLVEVLKEAQKEENLGALGIKTVSPDGALQPSCFHFPNLTKNVIDSLGLYRFFSREWLANNLFDNFFDHQSVKKIDWIAGCFVLMPRQVLNKIGNVPEDYFMFGEDIDLCYRIWQAGYEVVFYPHFEIIHKGNQSAGQLPSNWRIERTLISKYAFCHKHFGRLKGKLIQFSDYLGFFFGRIWLGFRKPDSPLKEEWKKYEKIAKKSLKLNYQQMLDFLNDRTN